MNKMKIGADPEFLIEDRYGDVVNAENILRGHEVGADASGTPAELRPKPKSNPLALVKEIKHLVAKADRVVGRRLTGYHFYAGAGSSAAPTGGHIHISGYNSGRQDLAKILDKYLSVPLTLVEDKPEKLKERRGFGYGRLGDYREADTHSGIEYRTPASWLTSPQMAESVLSLAWAIAYEFKYRRYPTHQMKFDPDFQGIDENDWHRWHNSVDVSKLKTLIPRIYRDIKKFQLYKRYQTQIDRIFRLIKKGQRWDSSKDMRSAWKAN